MTIFMNANQHLLSQRSLTRSLRHHGAPNKANKLWDWLTNRLTSPKLTGHLRMFEISGAADSHTHFCEELLDQTQRLGYSHIALDCSEIKNPVDARQVAPELVQQATFALSDYLSHPNLVSAYHEEAKTERLIRNETLRQMHLQAMRSYPQPYDENGHGYHMNGYKIPTSFLTQHVGPEALTVFSNPLRRSQHTIQNVLGSIDPNDTLLILVKNLDVLPLTARKHLFEEWLVPLYQALPKLVVVWTQRESTVIEDFPQYSNIQGRIVLQEEEVLDIVSDSDTIVGRLPLETLSSDLHTLEEAFRSDEVLYELETYLQARLTAKGAFGPEQEARILIPAIIFAPEWAANITSLIARQTDSQQSAEGVAWQSLSKAIRLLRMEEYWIPYGDAGYQLEQLPQILSPDDDIEEPSLLRHLLNYIRLRIKLRQADALSSSKLIESTAPSLKSSEYLSTELQKHCIQAAQLLREKEAFLHAGDLASLCQRIFPDNDVAYYYQGILLNESEQSDKALHQISQAITLNPDVALYYQLRARMLENTGQRDAANADYGKTIELGQDSGYARLKRALFYEAREKYQLALQDLDSFIEENPDDAAVYCQRAEVYLKMGKENKAEADSLKALHLNAQYGPAYAVRAQLMIRQGNNIGAFLDFSSAIKYAPDQSKIYVERGKLYTQVEDFLNAMRDFNQALKADPYNEMAYYHRGRLFHRNNQYDHALNDYNKALSLHNGLHQAYNYRGLILRKTDHFQAALEDYNRALQIRADYAECLNNRANLYIHLQQLEEAEQDVLTAISCEPGHCHALGTLAEIFAMQGRSDDFYRQLQTALQAGYPLRKYLDHSLYQTFWGEERFQALLYRYELIPENEELVN